MGGYQVFHHVATEINADFMEKVGKSPQEKDCTKLIKLLITIRKLVKPKTEREDQLRNI